MLGVYWWAAGLAGLGFDVAVAVAVDVAVAVGGGGGGRRWDGWVIF